MPQPFPDDAETFDPERRPPWPTAEELAIADDEEEEETTLEEEKEEES